MNFESLFDKILIFYNVKTVTDLADKLKVTRSTVSGWKNRQATGAILEFLFNNDLKALQYIFNSDKNTQTIGIVTNSNINKLKDSKENQTALLANDLSKYFIALESVATATNKEDELIDDIKELMKKYIG